MRSLRSPVIDGELSPADMLFRNAGEPCNCAEGDTKSGGCLRLRFAVSWLIIDRDTVDLQTHGVLNSQPRGILVHAVTQSQRIPRSSQCAMLFQHRLKRDATNLIGSLDAAHYLDTLRRTSNSSSGHGRSLANIASSLEVTDSIASPKYALSRDGGESSSSSSRWAFK